MTRVANFLVKNHWDIVKVVFPSSMAFGFVYTMAYGTSPLADAKKGVVGTQSDTIMRFNSGSLRRQRGA
ncbi:hypothetical protein BSKO_13761 [Bryopsis sp. KO-2023]|nr:hypothetical protein BSKO_13761 [Bryopsis sp. KO-2023]